MSARRGPLVVGLKLDAERVVRDPQVTIAPTHHRGRHDRLHFLRHHANVGLVAAVVGEAIEAEAIFEVAEEEDVMLEHHVGSANDTPGGPPCNTSHTDDWCHNGPD